MLSDVGSIIANFSVPGGVFVRRHAPGFRTDGHYQDGPVRRFKLKDISIQEMSEAEIQTLPENLRVKQNITIYSRLELQIINVAKQTSADLLEYLEDVFEVHKVSNWGFSGGYFKSGAVRVDAP